MEHALLRRTIATIVSCVALMLVPATSSGQVVAAPFSAFSGLAPITFTGLPDGLEVNGLIVDGIRFTYSLGNAQVVIDGGPGNTNNVQVPNAVSVGSPTGILTVFFPSITDMFGYGFALLTIGPVANATTITAFSGATNLGTVIFPAAGDPAFTGGFAGIQSSTPFDRVQFTFNSAQAPAFAFDNIRLRPAGGSVSTVPEPSSTALMGFGLAIFVGMVRRKRKVA